MAADKLYRSNVTSGEPEEDTKAHVIQLYRERNAIVDKDGTRKLAAPVHFIDAVMLLSCHSKIRQLSAMDLLQHQVTVLQAHHKLV